MSSISNANKSVGEGLRNLDAAVENQSEKLAEFEPVQNIIVMLLSVADVKDSRVGSVFIALARKIDSVYANISSLFAAQKETIKAQAETIENLSASIVKNQDEAEKAQFESKKELSALQEKMELTEKKLAERQETYNRLEGIFYALSEATTKEKQEAETNCEKARSELNEVSQELKDQKALYEILSVENEKNKKEIDRLKEVNQSQFKQLSMKDRNIRNLRGIVESTDEKHKKQTERSNKQKAQLTESLALSEASRQGLENDVNQLRLEKQTLEKTNAAFTAQITQQAQENEILRKKLEAAEAEIQRKNRLNDDHVDFLNAELDKEEEKVKELTSMLEGLQAEVVDRTLNQKTILELTPQISKPLKGDKIEFVEDPNNEPGGPRHVAHEALRQQQEALDKKRAQIHDPFEIEQSNLKNERNEVDMRHNALLKSKKSMKREINEIERDRQETLQELQVAEDEIKHLYQELYRLNNEEKSNERMSLQFQVQLEALEVKKIELTNQIDDLDLQIDIKDREMRDVREDEGSVDVPLLREIEAEMDSLESQVQGLREKRTEINRKQEGFQKDIDYLALVKSEKAQNRSKIDENLDINYRLKDMCNEELKVLDKRLETLYEELEEARFEIKQVKKEDNNLAHKEQVLVSSLEESKNYSLREEKEALFKAKMAFDEFIQPRRSPFQRLIASITG